MCAGEVRGGICKNVIRGGWLIVKLPNPPCPLDIDSMIQIKVCMVCTKRLVCTWYVPVMLCSPSKPWNGVIGWMDVCLMLYPFRKSLEFGIPITVKFAHHWLSYLKGYLVNWSLLYLHVHSVTSWLDLEKSVLMALKPDCTVLHKKLSVPISLAEQDKRSAENQGSG